MIIIYNNKGYDSIFMQCTQKNDVHLEGVMISYKRDLFQLFKTYFIEFNHAADALQGRV